MKKYIKPEVRIVLLKQRAHLMAGSEELSVSEENITDVSCQLSMDVDLGEASWGE